MAPARELWEQCVVWLKAAGILHADENFGKLADFAAILRNGVLLCELALRLKPDSIERSQILIQYQHSPFTCAKNIKLFSDACQLHFGIANVFSEDDLYGLENFGAVLRLLSQLSRTQIARQLSLKPFPEETTLPSELDDDNIYSNLREEVEQYQELHEQQPQQYAILSKMDEEDRRMIYDTICGQKLAKNSTRLPVSYSEFKPSTKREHCLKELLDTEINYANALQRIVDIFYKRLQFCMSTNDLAIIFINIRDILAVNLDFLSKLEPAVLYALKIELPSPRKDAAEPSKVSDVFISFKKRFTIYGKYCALLDASTNRIEELERTVPKFKEIITQLASDGQFRLNALLSIPFQRITKYHLILDSLRKSDQDVAEQADLHAAYECMKDVCDYVNEMKRDHETIEFINTVDGSINSLDLQLVNYGRLLCDGFVKVSRQNSTKQRYVFLFEKMMLFCKRENSLYRKKAHLLFSDFELLENELDLSASSRNIHNTLSRRITKNFFDNISLTIAPRRHVAQQQQQDVNEYNGNIQLVFKSVKQRDEWKSMVRKAIELCTPSGAIAKGHTVLYKTYTDVVNCSVCQLLLRGKFFQGYHCSGCNRDMHRECAGIKECVITNGRRSIIVDTSMTSSNGTLDSSHYARTPKRVQNFFAGEVVVWRLSSSSSTASMPSTSNGLCCKNGDLIELLEVHPEDGTALARLSHQPQSVGTVPLDGLVKTASTLERPIHRRRPSARSSTNSISDVIPMQSPTASNGTLRQSTPLIQQTPELAGQEQKEPEQPAPFVSRYLVKLCESCQDIRQQPWYFGEMDRKVASKKLEGAEEGTFIVRWSSAWKHFSISLVCADNTVRHMRVLYSVELNKYSLFENRYFDSVVDLVNYFRVNNLSEGFSLDATLRGTILKGTTYQAIGAYSRDNSSRYLTLKPGDRVTVLDTAGGDSEGWWKGSIVSENGVEKIGFFPASFVEYVPETENWRVRQQQQSASVAQQQNGRLSTTATCVPYQNAAAATSPPPVLMINGENFGAENGEERQY